MADYIVTSGELTSVANAIREKNGTSSSLSWPNGFVSGISSGGETWSTVFEGNVTTKVKGGAPFANGDITGVEALTADTIKVTFNGVEYTCEKRSENDSYGAPYNDGYDWSEYPFCITTGLSGLILVTQTAGTYSLKIEEPQSGGSSDFSTAQVTFVNNNMTMPVMNCICPNTIDGDEMSGLAYQTSAHDVPNTVNAVLYKGTLAIPKPTDSRVTLTVEVSGNASLENNVIIITGDCTITIS